MLDIDSYGARSVGGTSRTSPIIAVCARCRNERNQESACSRMRSASSRSTSCSSKMTPLNMMVWCVIVLVMTFSPRTSAMLFQTQSPETSPSCVPGVPQQGLRSVTSGLSNNTYLFNTLLRNIARERVAGTRGNYQVREFISSEMMALGWDVDLDRFVDDTPLGQISFVNIIATFNPTAPKRVVVACHYDSKSIRGARFVGAMDAAAACAIMIDTARKLHTLIQAAQDHQLNNFSLQFLFFDGEEAFVRWTAQDSLYGSRHLAQMWETMPDPNDDAAANNLQNIQLFVLLDLIGSYRTRFVNYYANTTNHFNRMTDIETCLRNSNLLTSWRLRPRIFDPNGFAGPVEDDHTPFIRRGVKVLHLISTPFPWVWHTAYDTVTNLNTALIEDFSRIFRVYITTLLMGL